MAVGQPLTHYTTQDGVITMLIVHARCDPIGVPEIELCQIPMKVPLRAVLIDAFHATFEYTEKA